MGCSQGVALGYHIWAPLGHLGEPAGFRCARVCEGEGGWVADPDLSFAFRETLSNVINLLFMRTTRSKLVPVVITVMVAFTTLTVSVFLATGGPRSADLFGDGVWYLACICVTAGMAGLVRPAIPGSGHLRSVLCGFIIAGIGCIAALGYAVSRI